MNINYLVAVVTFAVWATVVALQIESQWINCLVGVTGVLIARGIVLGDIRARQSASP